MKASQSNVPERPAQNILDYIRASYKYDAVTGLIYGVRGKPFNNVNSQGYIQIDLLSKANGRVLKAHHVAWFLYYDAWPSEQLDHEDQVRTHNWIKNLRYSNATAQKLNCARSLSRDLPPGVYFEGGKYVAKATIDGKTTYLGRSNSIDRAVELYSNQKRKVRT